MEARNPPILTSSVTVSLRINNISMQLITALAAWRAVTRSCWVGIDDGSGLTMMAVVMGVLSALFPSRGVQISLSGPTNDTNFFKMSMKAFKQIGCKTG